MEGFCRGCLIKYDEPTDLLHYTEKNRRLYVYSTGLQVKHNDSFQFQLCKECYLNMKQSCKFKKQCRTSDKRFKHYLALKNAGDSSDFCTFLKNNEDSLMFRFPMLSGSSTPANQKTRDEDNESTCTSIRNFMTDILRADEIPAAEARIIREVIEEEADVLDDSLDSHWLQDDASIDTDFRLDFSFSPFSTPLSVNNDRCLTPQKLKPSIQANDKINNFTKKLLEVKNIDPHLENYNNLSTVKHEHLFSFEDDESKMKNENHAFNLQKENDESNLQNENHANLQNGNDESNLQNENHANLQNGNDESNLQNENHANLQNGNDESNLQNENHANLQNGNDESYLQNENHVANLQTGKDMPSLDEPMENHGKVYRGVYYMENDGVMDVNIDNVKQECPDVIDKNLEEALKDSNEKKFALEDLLGTPRVCHGASAMSTPTVNNILFGEKLDLDEENFNKPELGQCIEKYEDIEGDIDIFEDFFELDLKDKEIENTEKNASVKKPEPLECKYDLTDNSCKTCDKKYNTAKALKIHFAKFHKQVICKREKKYVPRPGICDFCGKNVSDYRNLIRHMKLHMKPVKATVHQCTFCKLTFSAESKLRMHMTTHIGKAALKPNTKRKKHACPICGYPTSNAGNLSTHMRRHTKSYLHKCDQCDMGFYRNSDLVTHMRKHNGERPHGCNQCDKTFARRDTLNRHVKTHMDEKQYECSICNKEFATKNYLNQHKKSAKCFKIRLNKEIIKHHYDTNNSDDTFYFVIDERNPSTEPVSKFTVESLPDIRLENNDSSDIRVENIALSDIRVENIASSNTRVENNSSSSDIKVEISALPDIKVGNGLPDLSQDVGMPSIIPNVHGSKVTVTYKKVF